MIYQEARARKQVEPLRNQPNPLKESSGTAPVPQTDVALMKFLETRDFHSEYSQVVFFC
jgi:hypothetical protein